MNKVLPIKDPVKLKEIQEELAMETDPHWERIFLLFELGIHTGLRISDLVRLRVCHVQGEWLEMVEKKTGKVTRLPLNTTIRMILQDRLRGMDPDDLLFPSRTRYGDGSPKAITTRSAYDDIKKIAVRFNLGERIGCHTMRKTFGYWHYKNNKALEMLRQWFNHASQAVTLRYIGMDEDEKRKSVIGFNPGGAVYKPRGAINRGKPDKKPEPLEIKNLDREKQGRAWGERARQRAEKSF